MKNKISNLIQLLREKINNLSNVQKLSASIAFLIIMILVTNIIFQNILRRDELNINYKSVDIENLYAVSYSFYDESDLYAQLKKIADNIIEGLNEFNSSKNMTKDNIYKYCLYPKYKENLSKNKYKKTVENFLNKVNENTDLNIGYIPDDIVRYRENFYIVSYKNSDNIESYLGIMLNSKYNEFYIWYID